MSVDKDSLVLIHSVVAFGRLGSAAVDTQLLETVSVDLVFPESKTWNVAVLVASGEALVVLAVGYCMWQSYN